MKCLREAERNSGFGIASKRLEQGTGDNAMPSIASDGN